MKLVACNQLFHTVPVPQVEAVPLGQMSYRYNKLSQVSHCPVGGTAGTVGHFELLQTAKTSVFECK